MTTGKRPKLVIGLIGGIGSGKSQVAAAFARHGAHIISGDQLGQAALQQPDKIEQIVKRWGKGVLNERGDINRRCLAEIVFAQPQERKALEAITHPWIRQSIRREIESSNQDPGVRFIVLDAAVMLEAGWNELCDRLVYVEAPRALRLERLTRQRGWSEKEVAARERAQLPLTEKVSQADHVLDNSSSLEHLHRQVDDLLQLWGIPRGEPVS
jgi:dephospho-CoA kinase